MIFTCAGCSGHPTNIYQPGSQVYRVCSICGPGWFNYLGAPIVMIDTPEQFAERFTEIDGVTIHTQEQGVGIVFDDESQFIMVFPFTWEEFSIFVNTNLKIRR